MCASCVNCSTINTFKKHLSSELESEAVKFSESVVTVWALYGEIMCLLMPASSVDTYAGVGEFGEFSKFCSERIHRLNDPRLVCKFCEIWPTGNR